MSKLLGPGIIGVLLLAMSCNEDAEPAMSSEHGRWEVIAATRGNRPTETLNGAYFNFDTARQELLTNFSGEEVKLSYTRDGTALLAKGSPLLSSMRLEAVTDSTLALTTEISGLLFSFDMVPITNEDQ